MTIPTFTRTIDNAMMTTWLKIRPDAMDNILAATPVWAILIAAGCMTPQTGGKYINRPIRYGQATATAVTEGDQLPQENPELETDALWTFRNIVAGVTRSVYEDRENQGEEKVKSLVGLKLEAARDALEQKFESSMFGTHVTAETGREFQGLNDMIPPVATRATGTYGGIDRPLTFAAEANGVVTPATGNTWWGSKYYPGTLVDIEDNLLDDMKRLFNSCTNNQSSPTVMLTTQALFELYETFALDASQIIKGSAAGQMADLGFETLQFKGKPICWSSSVTANTMFFLNTDFIEVVYDPTLWFDMTDWKAMPLEAKRIAHIMCTANMISNQLRRHGRLIYS